jgi:hypothetical protein
MALVADVQGGVWAGGQGTKLFHIPSGKPTWAMTLGDWKVQVAYLGPAGDLWIGTTTDLWHETPSGRHPINVTAIAGRGPDERWEPGTRRRRSRPSKGCR